MGCIRIRLVAYPQPKGQTKEQQMREEVIRPIAQRIYEYRIGHGLEGSADNDWELAKEYVKAWAFLLLDTYCEMVFENKLTRHKTRPLIKGGY